MTDERPFLETLLRGWQDYQALLIEALAPLSADQLDLRPAPGLRSVGEVVTHMIGARGRWLRGVGEPDEPLLDFSAWDRGPSPKRSASELVEGLEATWLLLRTASLRWSPAEWEQVHARQQPDDEPYTQRWVVWHLVEHDLFHGGEVGVTLGLHGLKGLDV